MPKITDGNKRKVTPVRDKRSDSGTERTNKFAVDLRS